MQITLGVFLGTFAYALTVLRTVRTGADDQELFVPQIAVTVAFLLAVASVFALVIFLAHLAKEIRVETMLAPCTGMPRQRFAGSCRSGTGSATGRRSRHPPGQRGRAGPVLRVPGLDRRTGAVPQLRMPSGPDDHAPPAAP